MERDDGDLLRRLREQSQARYQQLQLAFRFLLAGACGCVVALGLSSVGGASQSAAWKAGLVAMLVIATPVLSVLMVMMRNARAASSLGDVMAAGDRQEHARSAGRDL